MQPINGRRVLGGGLLAGLVMNVAYALAEGARAAQTERMMERLGLAHPGEAAMIVVALGGFVVGLTAVWLYAAIRPRYGPGIGTAARAALAVWTLACLFPNAAMLAFGIMAADYFWMASLSDLLIVPAGTAAGAWIYREAPVREVVPGSATARAGA